MNLHWQPLIGEQVKPLAGLGWRAVENQQDPPTTLALVDSLEELEVLEQCIDEVKPKVPDGISANQPQGFLLTTPFRYPPLQYGSRFGSRHEMGIFYCAKEKQTALCEGAYYGMLLYRGMQEPPPNKAITQRISVFSVEYAAPKGLELHSKAFANFQELLRNPSEYRETQRLGSVMRDFGIDGFEYASARSKDRSTNLGFFHSAVFKSDPQTENWLKEITPEKVTYLSRERNHPKPKRVTFQIDGFLVDGVLPQPAT